MNDFTQTLLVTTLVLSSMIASAHEAEYIWGSEFTFSNHEIGKHYDVNFYKSRAAIDEARVALTKEYMRLCPECSIVRVNNDTVDEIHFPDGYWIRINKDPGVVETQAKPATLHEYITMKDRFDLLFQAAANVGLFPDTFMSGGHIHIGLKEFGNDLLLLRNFLVDFSNHFELAEGILDLNQKNSPSIRELHATFQNIDKLKNFITRFDAGEIQSHGVTVQTVTDLVYAYYALVQGTRYEALNLQNKHGTIEIRSIRTQANFDEYLKEVTLFRARLKYLKRLSDQNIKIPVEDYVDSSKLGSRKFDKLLVQKFYDYVTESGLSWKEYRPLIYLPDLKRKQVQEKRSQIMCKEVF